MLNDSENTSNVECENTIDELRACIDGIVKTLEEQVEQELDPTSALRKKQLAEMLNWRRQIERQEEMHALQVKFWRNLDRIFSWGRRR